MKTITYKLEIHCRVNKSGAVIPTGASECILDDKGKHLNMLVYPQWYKIVMIWMGKYFSYPLKK
jgi:hypothetical protein